MDSISNDHQEFEQVEAIDELLEDFWFFDNLLDRRSRILRYCHSDPYPFTPSPSSTCPNPDFPIAGDHSDLEKKLLEASTEEESVSHPCIERKEGGAEPEPEPEPEKINKMRRQFSEKIMVQERRTYLQKKEHVVREKGIKEGSKKNRAGSSNSNNRGKCCSMGGSLQRTQTLPSYIGRKDDGNEFQDQESDDSRMGFLIREAISSSSLSKQNTPKISNIPRHRPPRNSRSEEAIQEMVVKSQSSSPNRKTLRKTLSSIETKEILTLKDLEIESEKNQEEEEQRKVPRATAVKSQSAAVVGQPIPVWVTKDSSRDMKAQIKFWARTVASNVRQEC